MKRITLILSLIFLLGMTVSNAEIKRGDDAFSGKTRIISKTSMEYPVDSISMIKIFESKQPEYSIYAKVKSSRNFALSKTFLELKIDDEPSFIIDIKEGSAVPATDNRYMISSSITVALSPQSAEKISNATRVSLRFQTLGGYTPVYVLPESVLAEWKEVIATEK